MDYLREQVRVLVEHQEKQNKRIRLTNSQRMRVAAKATDVHWDFELKISGRYVIQLISPVLGYLLLTG